jgi:hypothetical protein
VINLKIKLEPCYPEGITRKEQVAHIKQEYEIKMKGFATLDYLSVLEEVEDV